MNRRLDVDGNIYIPGLRPRAHARRPLGPACTWSEACDAADEAIELLGGKPKDRGIWVWYCTYVGVRWFLDRVYEIKDYADDGRLDEPVKAFQKRLKEALPKGGAR